VAARGGCQICRPSVFGDVGETIQPSHLWSRCTTHSFFFKLKKNMNAFSPVNFYRASATYIAILSVRPSVCITPIAKVTHQASNFRPISVCNSYLVTVSREVRRPQIHLSSTTPPLGRSELRRPVCVPAVRLDNCRGHRSPSHCSFDVVV